MSLRIRGLAAAALLATTALSAQAADLGYKKPAVLPTLATFNPWQIRVRAIGVLTGNFKNATIAGAKTIGANGKLSDSVVPELDITYYFTKNIAAELILGTSHHNIKGAGTVLAGTGNLGSTWALPPTLTLQYHFTDFGAFKPYIGAGVNYTLFYGEKHGTGVLPGLYNFHVNSAAGVAAQVGFDYMFDKNCGASTST